MTNCNGMAIPMKRDVQATDNDLLPDDLHKGYQSLVGALNWAAVVTRPDISFTVSRFLSKPAKIHKEAARQGLRYLAKTIQRTFEKPLGKQEKNAVGTIFEWVSVDNTNRTQLVLVYGIKPPNSELVGYTDSNFAADTENRRSTSGFLFKLNGACVHWQSKQQNLVAKSTHEAEYIGMATASYEISYLRKLLADISHSSINDMDPTLLYGDNMSAIATAVNPYGDRTARSSSHRYSISYKAC
jgi:hypothetical protein